MPRSRFTKAVATIDASCLGCLLHLDLSFPDLNLFRALSLRYHTIHIPQHVWNEVSRKGRRRYTLQRLLQHHPFLKKCNVTDEYSAQLLYDRNRNPRAPIDRGEAEAIIQAREIGASEILIDDLDARKYAEAHSLNLRGTLGLLKELKRTGIIPEVKSLIEKCRTDIGFRLWDKLLKEVLSEVGED